MRAPNEFKEQKGVEAPVAFTSKMTVEALSDLSKVLRDYWNNLQPPVFVFRSGGQSFHANGIKDVVWIGESGNLPDHLDALVLTHRNITFLPKEEIESEERYNERMKRFKPLTDGIIKNIYKDEL